MQYIADGQHHTFVPNKNHGAPIYGCAVVFIELLQCENLITQLCQLLIGWHVEHAYLVENDLTARTL